MPLAGETYECSQCHSSVLWAYGEGMRLRHEPGYWLDGDGIDRHVCDPTRVAQWRMADALLAVRAPAAPPDDYRPAAERSRPLVLPVGRQTGEERRPAPAAPSSPPLPALPPPLRPKPLAGELDLG